MSTKKNSKKKESFKGYVIVTPKGRTAMSNDTPVAFFFTRARAVEFRDQLIPYTGKGSVRRAQMVVIIEALPSRPSRKN